MFKDMSVYFYSFIYFWSLGNITDITSRALKLNFLVFFLDHVISLSHSHEKFLPCGTPYVQTITYSQLLETIVTIRYPDVFMFCAVRFFIYVTSCESYITERGIATFIPQSILTIFNTQETIVHIYLNDLLQNVMEMFTCYYICNN